MPLTPEERELAEALWPSRLVARALNPPSIRAATAGGRVSLLRFRLFECKGGQGAFSSAEVEVPPDETVTYELNGRRELQSIQFEIDPRPLGTVTVPHDCVARDLLQELRDNAFRCDDEWCQRVTAELGPDMSNDEQQSAAALELLEEINHHGGLRIGMGDRIRRILRKPLEDE